MIELEPSHDEYHFWLVWRREGGDAQWLSEYLEKRAPSEVVEQMAQGDERRVRFV